MVKLLLYKWFGLEDTPCVACEILREQLIRNEQERADLLHRLLDKPQTEPLPVEKEEQIAIKPQYVPWRVRQQLLEEEDRKQAQLMRDKQKEIAELEKEVGIG